MFTWICPQCGGEVLPSQEECPRCVKPAQTAQPVPAAQPAPTAQPAAVPPALPPQPQAPQPPQAAPQPFPPAPAPVYHQPALHHEHHEPRSTGLRDTLVTVGVAIVLLGAGYFFWNRNEQADKPETAAKTELEQVKGAKSTHPLAKQIEVTGVRLRLPKPGQADIQLLVVNHSAAEIADLSIDVVLGAKGTAKEVAVFNVKVKRLSPFGSAEVSAKAKTQVSAIDLPDWQFLEPKVVIQSNE